MDNMDEVTVTCQSCKTDYTFNVLEETPADAGWYIRTHHYKPNDAEWAAIKEVAENKRKDQGDSKSNLRRKHQRAAREIVRCPDCVWSFSDLDQENVLQ